MRITPPVNIRRRTFIRNSAMGCAGLALASLLQRDGYAKEGEWVAPDGVSHFTPKVKSVIWLFMNGGVSQVESFDPKPMLNRYAGKTIADTPFADVQDPNDWWFPTRTVTSATSCFRFRRDFENMDKAVLK